MCELSIRMGKVDVREAEAFMAQTSGLSSSFSWFKVLEENE